MSENSISKFLNLLGQDSAKLRAFLSARLATVCKDHHILIDGTLKRNPSIINSLSSFSRKSRVKGCKDISVMFAYNLEAQEPLCAQVFPGNMIDARAYRAFVVDNNINRGILIADKGFPPNEVNDLFEKYPDLHFLTPLKRNDLRIEKYDLLDFDDFLRGTEKRVRCKKVNLKNGRFLYSFQDLWKMQNEDATFLDQQRKSGTYDKESYDKKKASFGTIVFESDLDMTCETVFSSYEERWMLEMFFDVYKNSLEMGLTRVQSDYSVIGSEFIDLIATILTSRIVKRMTAAGVLDNDTFSHVVDSLRSCWRHRDAPRQELPAIDDEYWVRLLKTEEQLLATLGLVEAIEKEPPKRRRRPRKETPQEESQKREAQTKNSPGRPRIKPIIYAPPRPRGRPRKLKTFPL